MSELLASLTRRQILLLTVGVEAGMGLLALGLGWAFNLPVTEWVRPDKTGFVLGVLGIAILLGTLLLSDFLADSLTSDRHR